MTIVGLYIPSALQYAAC